MQDFPTELKRSDLGDLRVLLIIQNGIKKVYLWWDCVCISAREFRQFSCKSSPELDVFCYFHYEYPKFSLLWEIGLGVPLGGVLVTIFVLYFFSCFSYLTLDNTITKDDVIRFGFL